MLETISDLNGNIVRQNWALVIPQRDLKLTKVSSTQSIQTAVFPWIGDNEKDLGLCLEMALSLSIIPGNKEQLEW